MRLTPRDYQRECIDAHYGFFTANSKGNPLFVVPTGAGKSLIIAEFIRESLALWPETRFLVLTHVRELIEQNYLEFVGQWGEAIHPAGIYSAGMNRRDLGSKVLFAGIHSIVNRAEELGSFDLVLVDEAHLVPKKGMGRYRTYLNALQEINPCVRVCGYTATHYRMDGGYLHKGKERLFTDVAFEVGLDRLVPEFLCPLIARQPKQTINTDGVKTTAGDFNNKALAAVAISDVEAATLEAISLARKYRRHHWLVFACSIEHAEEIAKVMRERKVDTECIYGTTRKDLRDSLVKRFKAGKLTCLINVGVLTTGFNAKLIDCLIVMRPTKSTALYVQIMGRGMRNHPGKEDCLVLDYGENVMRHGPINRVKPRRGPQDGEPPVKICPGCALIVALGTMTCPDCGHEWQPVPIEIEHETEASGLQIIDFAEHVVEITEHPVNSIDFTMHYGKSGIPSMRVSYSCGMLSFSEYVCFQHPGRAGQKAKRWWATMTGIVPTHPDWYPPQTVDEAIDRCLNDETETPATILVRPRGSRYFDVVSYTFPSMTKPVSRLNFNPVRPEEPTP